MATLNQIFGIGLSGLNANKALAAVASNNIANANTPGYVRRVLLLGTQTAGLLGVQTSGPLAVRNAFLAHQLVTTFGRLGYHTGRQTALSLIEPLTNELDNVGLEQEMVGFDNALRALSSDPGGEAPRAAVVAAAKDLITGFHAARAQLLDGAQASVDSAQGVADKVTTLAQQVAALNGQIRTLVEADKDASELIDQRDKLVGDLGELVDVQIVDKKDGSVSLFIAGGRSLVEGDTSSEVSVSEQGGAPDYAVTLSITRDGKSLGPMAPIGGKLGGLIDAHDEVIATSLRDLDQMAFEFTQAFNTQHEAGQTLDGSTGVDFFDPLTSADGAAANIELSADILASSDNVAAAAAGEALPGGAGNLTALADLVSSGGALADGSSLIAGWRGVRRQVTDAISLAKTGVAIEESTANQLQSLLLSETGVSVDEELVTLTQANAAYEAASQIITVAQKMTDTVLGLVG